MPNVTIEVNQQLYPNGSTLRAYPRSNWATPGDPVGVPQGAYAATGTVANGKVTFSLSPGYYWLTGTTSPYRYFTVVVSAPDSGGGIVLPAFPPEDGRAYVLLVLDGDLSWYDINE